MIRRLICWMLVLPVGILGVLPADARAEGNWEVTKESEEALNRGLEWLARNQGEKGNWDSQQMGLVSMGLMAFLSAGHLPGRGKYGENSQRALNYILEHAKPSGLLNDSVRGYDMYNHGLTTFVLGQVYGMTGDKRVGRALDKALQLIQASQCADGGWDYTAVSKAQGHDLSLCVMQAKALRSAMDCGFKVSPQVVHKAVESVRRYWMPNFAWGINDPELLKTIGSFSYTPNNRERASVTTTAIGVVCLQEFGQYDDPRLGPAARYLRFMIQKGEPIFNKMYRQSRSKKAKHQRPINVASNHVPFDAYTLYYLTQALYQYGGEDWKIGYTILRDLLVARQRIDPKNPAENGAWISDLWNMRGKDAQFYGTAIACFTLAIPNRYLPILQEGRVQSLVQPVGPSEK